MKYCIKCGRSLLLSASYCDRCGAFARQSQMIAKRQGNKGAVDRGTGDELKKILNLDGWPVGIKLLKNDDEIPSNASEIDQMSRHCEMIQRARMNKKVFYAPAFKQRCKVAAISLGLMEPTEELRKHQLQELFEARHRFETESLLWKFLENTPSVSERYSAVLYGPLDQISIDPDIVVLLCNPLQTMKLIQAYQYSTGERVNAVMGGLFSLCGDAVATPLLCRSLNIAIGCEGAREHAGLKDHEMSVSFPYNMTHALIDGLNTLSKYDETKKEHS